MVTFMLLLREHFYIGSANIGSRGASWTKELGVLATNCSQLARDARKIIDLYWSVDGLGTLPSTYPKDLATRLNAHSPIKILNTFDSTVYKVFIGSSPKPLNADGRTDDLTAILGLINSASEYIYIAVNEYIPMDLWKKKQPWTVIDDALKAAVQDRKVRVKLLVNSRASHKSLMLKHLHDLINFDPQLIQAKIYSVKQIMTGKVPMKVFFYG